MICQKCKIDFLEEKDIQEHHIHPRLMNNKKGIGEKIHLCAKCHNILHLLIATWIWNYVNDFKIVSWKTQINCIYGVKKNTLNWLKKDGNSIQENKRN